MAWFFSRTVVFEAVTDSLHYVRILTLAELANRFLGIPLLIFSMTLELLLQASYPPWICRRLLPFAPPWGTCLKRGDPLTDTA